MSVCTRVFVVFILLSGSTSPALTAQCPITVDAGPDKFVCNPGATTELEGNVSGSFIGFRWSPAAGLNNPALLNPTATVNNTVTYTLTAAAVDPSAPNLVNNPGFESGNTGFSSSFSYNPTPIFPGTYVITTSPSVVLDNFPPCDDHTYGNGTGNMMLCNGTGGANSQVWCQTIPVMANTWYVMSAWALCSPISPPVFQFRVNGADAGDPFDAQPLGCVWQEFTASWFSGASTSANLCIFDISGSGNGLFGDDFALDDIFMAKACAESDEVIVSVVQVKAMLPPSVILPCSAAGTGIVLDGSGSSSGPGYSYSWSGPGIVSGEDTPTPTVNEPGVYTLTVSFDTGNGICTKTASINVQPDPLQVTAKAAVNAQLSCANTTVLLNGTGSSVGGVISYDWQPSDGVVSGNGTLTPLVNQPGEYTLLVTHTVSGCTATATVLVNQNLAPAMAAASAPGPLSCTADTVLLSGAGSSTGNNFSYLWSGPGIVSGNNTLNNCAINAPGQYMLVVTNNTSGCTASASVAVIPTDSLPPAAATAGAPGVLNCVTPALTLAAAGADSNYTYQWTTPNGHFASPADTQTVTIDSAGLYILTVLNPQNGCQATDTLSIAGNFTPPADSILPVPPLTCVVDSVQIDASPSSGGPGFQPVWTTSGGLILSGGSTLTPWVGAAGAYTLLITDTLNGCTTAATVTVINDTLPPIATVSADAPGVLNCITPALTLNSAGSSSSDSIFTFQWATTNGHFTGPVNGQTAIVDTVGTYILTITNLLNGCKAADTVVVSGAFDPPLAVIAAPAPALTCLADSVQVDASFSSAGPDFQFLWTTADGVILSGDGTATPWAGAAGTYQLLVTDLTNGCTATAAVSVALDTVAPTVQIAVTGVLDCQTTELSLDAGGSSSGPGFSYQWSFTGAGIGIVSGDTSLMPAVNAPGVYTLTVTNTLSGCTASAGIPVQQSADVPMADAGPSQTLLCNMTQVVLDGSLSASGPGLAYAWSTPDGNIVQGANTLTPAVNVAGTYILTVTDTLNGCSAFSQVLVQADTNAPIADAGPPPSITCLIATPALDGSGSSAGSFVSYLWTTADGLILSGDTSAIPVVGAAGTYLLLVTDQTNGCTATASAVVVADTIPPQAVAASPQTLTCLVNQIALDGAGSSAGANFVYQWSGPGIVGDETTLSPTVNAAGIYALTVTDQTNGCTATASAVTTANTTPPQAVAASPQTLTCTLTQITLSGAGSSTGADFSYQWSGPGIVSDGTTLSPRVNAEGTYTLTVTDQTNGCTATASAVTTANTTPPQAVAASPQTLTCTLTQITLSGAGSSTGADFSYQWSGPGIVSDGTTLSPRVNAEGTYTLTVTDQTNGCTATVSAVATSNTAPPQAVAASPQTLTCALTQITLSGAGSSAGANFSYQWAGPGVVSDDTTLSPIVNAAGTYVLTVTDQTNGCTASASAVATANTALPQAVAASPQTLTCTLTQIALSGAGSSAGANFSYQWAGPGVVSDGTTLSPRVNAEGTYTLTVTDQTNGCTATASAVTTANTTPPQAVAASPQTLTCTLTQIPLSGAGSSAGLNYTYQWSGPGIVSDETTLSPIVNAAGTYALTVTDQTNGCTATASVTVTGTATPPDVDAGPDFTLSCNTPRVVLQGSSSTPGVTYSWSATNGNIVSGGSTANPTVDAPGLYTLLVTDPASGCTAVDAVAVGEGSVVFPTLVSIPPDCVSPTGSISFSGGAGGQTPFLYSIDGGATFSQDSLFDQLPPGIYNTVVQDAGGCEQTFDVEFQAVESLVIALDSSLTLQAGGSVQLHPTLSVPASKVAAVLWLPDQWLDCAVCLNPVAAPPADVTYAVLVVTTDGCTDTATVTIRVKRTESVYAPNAFAPEGAGANNTFRIYTNLPVTNFEMRIFDRWGGLLFETNDVNRGWDGTAGGKAMHPGVYAWYARFEFLNAKGETEERVENGGMLLVR